MKQQKFSVRNRIKSFKYAFNGLKILLKEEHNARVHLLAAILVVILSILLHISSVEWLAIVLSIGFVIALEIINSAIENIADFISPQKDERIKKIKDLAAAGVLTAAFSAVFIALIIFVPKLIDLL